MQTDEEKKIEDAFFIIKEKLSILIEYIKILESKQEFTPVTKLDKKYLLNYIKNTFKISKFLLNRK